MRLIPKKIFDDPAATKKAMLVLMALTLWSFFLWRAINVFGPGGNSNDISFNSDSAIPVIMSNDDKPITIFNLYYYGTDRWGGWPFLIAQFIRRTTGYRWSDQGLFTMQVIWIFVGALVMAVLSLRDRLLAALVYLIALCLQSEARYEIFELSQVYAWQVTALLLSWYSLRRLFESRLEVSGQKTSVWKRSLWRFLIFCFSFLAIWSSVASIPILFFLWSLEAWRAQLKDERTQEVDWKSLRRYLGGLILISAAALLELLQKMNYHRYALERYGNDFKTTFELDTGYLKENLKMQLHNLSKLSWWPFYLLPTLAIAALASYFLYLFFKKRPELRARLRAILLDETVILIVGAYGIAAINFVLSVMVSHVRINLYDERFLTLTSLFGPISGLLTLFLILSWAARRANLSQYAKPAFLLAGLFLLTLKFPAAGVSPEYKTLKETALALAQKAPRGILMGGYWETYVFVSLQPTNAMTPVPVEGQVVYMPWTIESLRWADQVVVEYRHSNLGEPLSPPPQLSQYGSKLSLVNPRWYENGEYAFALYVKEN